MYSLFGTAYASNGQEKAGGVLGYMPKQIGLKTPFFCFVLHVFRNAVFYVFEFKYYLFFW
jgi:hypothetical protein